MKTKILVVDDNEDIVTPLCDRLKGLGYSTVTANDGVQALEVIEREQPSLMLLDLEMPRMGGLELLKRLGSLGPTGLELPIIVMTAHGTIAKAVEAMKEGAHDFLTKPYDVDHLAIVIHKALERESPLSGIVPRPWRRSRRPNGWPTPRQTSCFWVRAARARNYLLVRFISGAAVAQCPLW
jgi:DNA-binding NtrC family response regulator